MRRATLVPALVVGAVLVVGGTAYVASAMNAAETGHTIELEPLTVSPGAAEPSATPTPSRSNSGGVVPVSPPASEDVGDDHGGSGENSGHGGGGSDDDNSGHGGGDDD
jgi:hypothetical protein